LAVRSNPGPFPRPCILFASRDYATRSEMLLSIRPSTGNPQPSRSGTALGRSAYRETLSQSVRIAMSKRPLKSDGRRMEFWPADGSPARRPAYRSGALDAAVLAKCLEQADAHDADAALRRYEQTRKPRASRYQEGSRRNGVMYHLADGEDQRNRDANLLRPRPPRSPRTGLGSAATTSKPNSSKGEICASAAHHACSPRLALRGSAPIARVEVSVEGDWQEARLEEKSQRGSWRRWELIPRLNQSDASNMRARVDRWGGKYPT
jgi:hypothetical protein